MSTWEEAPNHRGRDDEDQRTPPGLSSWRRRCRNKHLTVGIFYRPRDESLKVCGSG